MFKTEHINAMHNKHPDPLWFVAQIKPNSERIAVTHLERQGFDVFAPQQKSTHRKGHRFVEKITALFPSYVFVSFYPTFTHWRAVNSTRGVSRLISTQQRPQALPLGFVDALKAQCDDDMILRDQTDLCENMSVRVTQGPFSGLVGTVQRAAPKERVWVLLDLLGHSAPVNLSTQGVHIVSA